MSKIPASFLLEATNVFQRGGKGKTPGQEPGKQTPAVAVLDAAPETVQYARAKRNRVIALTPFAGEDVVNLQKFKRYSKRVIQDCISRGEAGIVVNSFLASTDSMTNQGRAIAIGSAVEWVKVAEVIAVYEDYGITPTMQTILNVAQQRNKRIEFRTVGPV